MGSCPALARASSQASPAALFTLRVGAAEARDTRPAGKQKARPMAGLRLL
jgi:hypothetical protein